LANNDLDISLLLSQCINNNEKAQLTIYNLYYKAMFNVSFRIVNDYAIAEDVMQESFLKAFQKLATFSKNVTFGAWLKKIVVNKSIDELKKQNKFQFESFTDGNQNSIEVDDSQNDNQNKINSVLETMKTLKPNYKLILTLFFIEGYDLEEITEILNITNENCRTMMSRAKESLRKKMNL
jgi:RNA polymerase sigma factor (sigma-70 family)